MSNSRNPAGELDLLPLTAESSSTSGNPEQTRKQVMDALRIHFKPEFLNRVDEIIVCNALGKEQLLKIIDLRLEEVRRSLADRKVTLEFTGAAKEVLLASGYDSKYGARPLKGSVQRPVQDSLAKKILRGEVFDGDHVLVDAEQNEITLTASRARGSRRKSPPGRNSSQ